MTLTFHVPAFFVHKQLLLSDLRQTLESVPVDEVLEGGGGFFKHFSLKQAAQKVCLKRLIRSGVRPLARFCSPHRSDRC